MQGIIFEKVLQMSLLGCYSIGLVLAVRLLLVRCGRRYAYQLWVLLFISLCLPVSLPGNYSLIPGQVMEFSRQGAVEQMAANGLQDRKVVIHRLSPGEVSSEEVRHTERPIENMEEFRIQGEEKKESFGEIFAGEQKSLFQEMEKIWISGVILFTVCILCSVCRISRQCSRYRRAGSRKEDGIVEAEGLPSPFLWGFFRPVIYLPSGLKGKERTYILAHEMIHRKRKDHLIRFLILAVTVLHWFNPLVWIAYSLCCRDMEISCDEAVLEGSADSIRKAYAESLLKYAAGQNHFILSPPGFGEPSVKSRIKNVLRFRRKSIWISAAAGLCVAGVAVGLLHRPEEAELHAGELVQETEVLQGREEPAVDADEGEVINNGRELISVAGEYYYMDGIPLYSDGKALYASVTGDDGIWHACRYEMDGSGSRKLFEGRIVDIAEYGQVLYCMFPAENSNGECLGWYNIQTEKTGVFSEECISCLGKDAGFLYTSRKEPDGLHVGRIREADLAVMPDPIEEGIPEEEILEFYADESRRHLIFVTETGGVIQCCSYNMESGAFIKKELTGLPYFAVLDGYLYFQREKSRVDHTMELFRTDYEFAFEEQVGEDLTLLCADERSHTLLAEKKVEHPDYGPVSSLVRVLPEKKEEQMVLDMERMLPAAGEEKSVGDVFLTWEYAPGDRMEYAELNLVEDRLYVTVRHLHGQLSEADRQEELSEEVRLTVNSQGEIGIWDPEKLTPGWKDVSWCTEPLVGQPADPEENGWDLRHAVDVREQSDSLPDHPGAAEKKQIYLLGETEHWTLYGKGDYQSMLLARNGRYSQINYPYMADYKISPTLLEADFDHDYITELAVIFNSRRGTGMPADTLLVADFENNGSWVYRFLEEDCAEQLTARLTSERTEHGLQAFLDGEPAGAVMEDGEEGRMFQSVRVGQQVRFFLDEESQKIRVLAELEFYDDRDSVKLEHNGCAVMADVIWKESEFLLKNVACVESGEYRPKEER